MKLFEYEAKEVFSRHGIPTPKGRLTSTPEEAGKAAAEIGCPVALKAQVMAGGRGLAGGILFAADPQEAEEKAAQLLGRTIRGFKVEKLLVEEKVEAAGEIYLGITVDTETGRPIVMASSEGGVEIEEVAARSPEKIASIHVDVFRGLRGYEARRLAKQIGLRGSQMTKVGEILQRLYQVFKAYDAELAEINPLALTVDGQPVALDARLNIEDHALYRHPEIDPLKPERFENPLELEGKRRGVNYVDLDGEVAFLANGAGLTMTLIDMASMAGLKPACFLDTGGGVSRERMRNALELILMKAERDPKVKAVLFNINLQITPPEAAAQGILDVLSERKPNLLIVGVVRGTGAEKSLEMLSQSPVKLCRDAMEAINLLVKELGR